jgi:hypothetical protein
MEEERSPESKKMIYLITPEQFASLPDGVILRNFFGEARVKGRDVINDETTGGFLSVGFLEGDRLPTEVKLDARGKKHILKRGL